ncbi:MAG: 16S rRNA (uracil(1498)-N(3))-methyltransferase [Spirochaetales bacterium]
MNLILLDSPAPIGEFPREDRRYSHLRKILRVARGTSLRAGVVNGPVGILEILEISEQSIQYRFAPLQDPIPPYPIEVILGAMRPIVARRLLKDLTALGIQGIRLVKADLSEGSYLQSSLWQRKEYERSLREGAEQGCTTILPAVHLHPDLNHCLSTLPQGGRNLLMDPEAPRSFFSLQREWDSIGTNHPVHRVAIGPERGWTERERNRFLEKGFTPCKLGERILRTEAAALIAVGILISHMEALQE